MRKGISSVIATVLMLAIVIAMAGAAWMFVSGVFTATTATAFSIVDSYQDTVTIRNDGTVPITSLTATVDGDNVNIAVVPPISGLVGYWSFNEGSGVVAGDSSGNGINFEVRNLVSWVDGKFGKAVQIGDTASTGCANQNAGVFTDNVPSIVANLPKGAFTQVFWVKPSPLGGTTQVHLASVDVPVCGKCSIWHQRGYIEVRSTAGSSSDIYYTEPSNP